MKASYTVKVQVIRSKRQPLRYYVALPLPVAPQSAFRVAKRSSGNCSPVGNSTSYAQTPRHQKLGAAPPMPAKSQDGFSAESNIEYYGSF